MIIWGYHPSISVYLDPEVGVALAEKAVFIRKVLFRKIQFLNILAQNSHLKLDYCEQELLASLEGMSSVGESGQGVVRGGHAAEGWYCSRVLCLKPGLYLVCSWWSMVQCGEVRSSKLQCDACNEAQLVSVWCSELQCGTVR